MDFAKPLSELTPAEVAQQMAALAQRNADLDQEMAEIARNMERLEAESNKSSCGIYDPNIDPSAVIEPSPEALAVAQMLDEIELSREQERYCAEVQRLFAAVLAPQLARRMAERRITDDVRAAWATFRQRCAENSLPHLPARPESLLMALADERDAASAQRLVDAVRLVHKNLGERDPQDMLVEEALRSIREDEAASAAEAKARKSETPQDEKGN